MLYEDFKTWKIRNGYSVFTDDEHDKELFKKFFEERSFNLSALTIVADLGWQIYYLQCCVEGLLEEA